MNGGLPRWEESRVVVVKVRIHLLSNWVFMVKRPHFGAQHDVGI